MWTTGGHQADYLWLAVRTDPDAPKHQGISILIVDTSDPGYTWTPIITADGSHHVNATYFNDVRVPVDMLVGEENQGWKLITTQLNHERVMLGPAGRLEGLRDRVAAWAGQGTACSTSPTYAGPSAEVTAAFRVNELLNWEVARAAERGEISVGDASRRRCSPPTRCSTSADLVAVVHRYGDPADAGHRRADELPRRPGQAEPRADLRRRRERGAARADRDVRARTCPRVPDERPRRRHERIMAEAERIKATGETARRRRRDPINQPMINNWVDAIGDDNPRYLAGEAPPAMAQVWTMGGLGRKPRPERPAAAR